MKTIIMALVLSISMGAQANLPPNNLHLQDSKALTNLSQGDFNKAIDFVIGVWQPVVRQHGAELIGVKKWDDPRVNAEAIQKGNQWFVTMFGGLARRPEVTLDGFVMVICHEIGHHLAGYYFVDDGLSAEGEADYWASQVCTKKVFQQAARRNAFFRTVVPPLVKTRCDSQYQDPTQQDLCYRAAGAGFSLSSLLATMGKRPAPRFDTPDRRTVTETFTDHPEAQCRLDTYFAGALCNAPFRLDVIPGKGLPQGNNSKQAELVAIQNSCSEVRGQSIGVRPHCWFKPQLTAANFRRR